MIGLCPPPLPAMGIVFRVLTSAPAVLAHRPEEQGLQFSFGRDIGRSLQPEAPVGSSFLSSTLTIRVPFFLIFSFYKETPN